MKATRRQKSKADDPVYLNVLVPRRVRTNLHCAAQQANKTMPELLTEILEPALEQRSREPESAAC